MIEKDKKEITNILFALRPQTEKGQEGYSAFERHMNRKSNTPKLVILNQLISENDSKLEISTDDFSEEVDSTILMRERARGSKLDGLFKKKNGPIVGESEHTITILPERGDKYMLAKRDVAGIKEKKPRSQKNKNRQKFQKWQKEELIQSSSKGPRAQYFQTSSSEEAEDKQEKSPKPKRIITETSEEEEHESKKKEVEKSDESGIEEQSVPKDTEEKEKKVKEVVIDSEQQTILKGTPRCNGRDQRERHDRAVKQRSQIGWAKK